MAGVRRQDNADAGDGGRLTSLDGLRGVAAVVVVMCHALLVVPAMSASVVSGAEPAAGSPEWFLLRTPLRVLTLGSEAVMIFFVLSGFVLTLGFMGRRMTPRFVLAYWGRRTLRLYVPVWAAIALALALAIAVPRDPSAASTWLASHRDPTAASVAKDAVLLLGTSNLNSPLWSLTWEVWFSLLLPGLWWLFGVVAVRRWWPGAVVVCLAVSGLSDLPVVHEILPLPFVTTGLLQYLPVFAIGMIFAMIFTEARNLYARLSTGARSAAWTVVLGLLVGPSMFAPFTDSPPLIRGLFWELSLLGAAGLVVLAAVSPRAQRGLSSRPVMFFGTRSFSLYLVHEPIIIAAALLVGAAGWWPWLGTLPLVLAVIVVVTMAFYAWVEKPSIVISRSVGRMLAGRRPTTATGASGPGSSQPVDLNGESVAQRPEAARKAST